jgi:hypothetical protein
MNYTIYDNATGEITLIMSGDDAIAMAERLQGLNYIEGAYSSDEYYINDTIPIRKPPKPQHHIWDIANKVWIQDTEFAALMNRIERNNLLTAIDRINPIWFNSLTSDQQTELTTYRQELLDVPQQTTFPSLINWPNKPSWL